MTCCHNCQEGIVNVRRKDGTLGIAACRVCGGSGWLPDYGPEERPDKPAAQIAGIPPCWPN
jgi:hypothetical protein